MFENMKSIISERLNLSSEKTKKIIKDVTYDLSLLIVVHIIFQLI